jgi:hypothetical protein
MREEAKAMKICLIVWSFVFLFPMRESIAQPTFSKLDYSFRPAKEWKLHSGRVLTFEYEPHKRTRIQDQNRTVFEIKYPEVTTQIVASDEGGALLLLVLRHLESAGGFNYAYLLTIQEAPGGVLRFERRLLADNGPMTAGRRVVELGAVSDDAAIALLKIGEPDNAVAPYKVGHIWERWDLVTPKLLKTGLSVGQ